MRAAVLLSLLLSVSCSFDYQTPPVDAKPSEARPSEARPADVAPPATEGPLPPDARAPDGPARDISRADTAVDGPTTDLLRDLAAPDTTIVDGAAPDAFAPDTTPPVRLGRLDRDWMLRQGVAVPAGTVTPAPTSAAGVCQTSDPSNWGDPVGSGPCTDYRPLLVTTGDLVVSGGAGQGVLAVLGDLTLAAGARFYGPVRVAGRLTVTGGSEIHVPALKRGALPLSFFEPMKLPLSRSYR